MVEFLQLGLGNRCLAYMKGLAIFLLERGADGSGLLDTIEAQ